MDQTQAWGLLSRSISFSGVLNKNKRKRYLKGLRDFSCLVFSSVAIIGRVFWDWDLQLIASETNFDKSPVYASVQEARDIVRVSRRLFEFAMLRNIIFIVHGLYFQVTTAVFLVAFGFSGLTFFIWVLDYWSWDFELNLPPQYSPLQENEGKK